MNARFNQGVNLLIKVLSFISCLGDGHLLGTTRISSLSFFFFFHCFPLVSRTWLTSSYHTPGYISILSTAFRGFSFSPLVLVAILVCFRRIFGCCVSLCSDRHRIFGFVIKIFWISTRKEDRRRQFSTFIRKPLLPRYGYEEWKHIIYEMDGKCTCSTVTPTLATKHLRRNVHVAVDRCTVSRVCLPKWGPTFKWGSILKQCFP